MNRCPDIEKWQHYRQKNGAHQTRHDNNHNRLDHT